MPMAHPFFMGITLPVDVKRGKSEKSISTGQIRYAIIRHNSANSVPTSNLVCIKEVAIRTTFCIAGIICYSCNLVINIQSIHYKNAFNKRFSRIVCQSNSAKIYPEKILTVCNAVYFRLCIDLMHITPSVTAEGFDVSHHPRYAEWYAIRISYKYEKNHLAWIYS